MEDIKPNAPEETETPEDKKENNNIIDIQKPKKNTFDMFVILREQGYSLKHIYDNNLLPLTYNSLKNYNCKYKKLLKEQEKELLKSGQLELAI